MKSDEREGVSSDTELLRAIQDGLVATYRDVLRQPIPDSVRDLLMRLGTCRPDVALSLEPDREDVTEFDASLRA